MIDIAPDSQTYLNVLDLSEENMDEDPVKVKSEFLLSFIGKLLDRKMDGRKIDYRPSYETHLSVI